MKTKAERSQRDEHDVNWPPPDSLTINFTAVERETRLLDVNYVSWIIFNYAFQR